MKILLLKIKRIKFLIGKIDFVRVIFNHVRENKLKRKYYKGNRNPDFKGVIFCVDGHLKHGGLGDRFFGILQTYALCKIHGINFKINYSNPFSLDNFLIPNIYDWSIKSSDVVYSKKTKPIIMLGDFKWIYKFKRIVKNHCQIHFYANAWMLDDINKFYKTSFTYEQLFSELFKKSELLKNDLESTRKKLPSKYISLCFRHRNIYGDFTESNFFEVEDSEKNYILNISKKAILEILKKFNFPVVVTSDSTVFLKQIKDIDGVFTVNKFEKSVHMDYVNNVDLKIYEQSFIDFFVLGDGEIVFQFLHKYNSVISGFPYLAAHCNGIEFKTLFLE